MRPFNYKSFLAANYSGQRCFILVQISLTANTPLRRERKKLKALFSGLIEPQQCWLLVAAVVRPLAELNDSCKAMPGPVQIIAGGRIFCGSAVQNDEHARGERFGEPHAPPFH
ncbi:hypothetical protein Tsp_02985 [Trichinella spiralis]|uniref:hypothetical protein n=1 Tax=Trichinella spiralis TaxID=6334 RepID=UPI0001EFB204|nr:hypothetical protein Tsp_02985 [Trichinella spiralis]